MIDRFDFRFGLLITLAVAGVALAGVAAAAGVTEPVTATGTAGEFVVSEDNVTFESDGRERPVVSNMSGVTRLEVERIDAAEFTIHTARTRPLTESDRDRAKRIARGNRTVRQAVDSLASATFEVEPIQKLTADASTNFSVDDVTYLNASDDGSTFTIDEVENGTDGEESDGVVVRRDPAYEQDEVAVHIESPDAERHFTVHVDLANGTVIDVVDWTDT